MGQTPIKTSLGLIYLDAVRIGDPEALPNFPRSDGVNFKATNEVLGSSRIDSEYPVVWLERIAAQRVDQFKKNYEDTKARLLRFLSRECKIPEVEANRYAMTLSLDLRVTNPPRLLRTAEMQRGHGWWPHSLESVYGFTRDDAEKVRKRLDRGQHTHAELEWFVAHPSSHPKIDKNKMGWVL